MNHAIEEIKKKNESMWKLVVPVNWGYKYLNFLKRHQNKWIKLKSSRTPWIKWIT